MMVKYSPSVTKMKPDVARAYLWALLDNATSLVEDAALLAEQSPARAQSLLILAYEELGKADWVYDAFWRSWNSGSSEALTVDPLSTGARHHGAKFLAGRNAASPLYDLSIWATFEEYEPVSPEASPEDAARGIHTQTPAVSALIMARANEAKQRGFYVDLALDGEIRTPRDLEVYDLDSHRGHIAAGIVYMISADADLVTRRVTSAEPAEEIFRRADAHARYDDY